MFGRARGRAAAVAAALIVVAGGATRAEVRVEKVEVPRDLGELPKARVDWWERLGDARGVTAKLDIHHDPELEQVQAHLDKGPWTVTLDPDDFVRDIAVTDDLVVLALKSELVGLDPHTGRRRWAARGLVEAIRPVGRDFIAVFRVPPLDPAQAQMEDMWPRDLARLDGRTGRPRWRVSCGGARCELADADDGRVLVRGREALVTHDGATGRARTRIETVAEVAFLEGDVAILSSPPGLEAVSLADGHPIWQGTLTAQGSTLAQRSGAHLVTAAENELSVFDWRTGEHLSTTQLPDGWSASLPIAAMSDGRVAVVESHDRLNVVAIVDPRGGRGVQLWSAYGEPDGAQRPHADPKTVHRKGWGTVVGPVPRPPKRQDLSLVEELTQRLDALAVEVFDPFDKTYARDGHATLSFLRRLPSAAYREAVLKRLRYGEIASPELVELLVTADGGKDEKAIRQACAEGLAVVVAHLPDTPAKDRPRRVRDGLWLMEATRGVLPEAAVRAVGGGLALLLREKWAALSPAGRAALGLGPLHTGAPWDPEVVTLEELLDESTRFLHLLWRAPYPDVDKPLRDAVAALGPARPCPYPMADPYHPAPRRPPDLSCKPDAPPYKAVRGGDWAVWTSPALGRDDELWGMTHAGKSWSEPRYLGDNETARAVLAAGAASTEQRFELLAALAFAARDTDADGLPDAVESTLGLDPTRADSDGDGLPDARDPSPLCAPLKRPLTRDEQIVADVAWTELGLRTEAMPAAFELPGGGTEACVEVPTLGGPVLVGNAAAVKALKARLPDLRIYSAGVEPLSPQARERVQPFEATLRGKPLAAAGWRMYRGPLNSDGRHMVVVFVGGRWRPVAVFMRVIS